MSDQTSITGGGPRSSAWIRWVRGAGGVALLAWVAAVRAEPTPAPSTALPVLSTGEQIWTETSRQPTVAFPIRVVGRVHYADPEWHNLWMGDDNGVSLYFRLAQTAPSLRNGQRVEITGQYARAVGLDANSTTVRVLDEYMPVTPQPIVGRISETDLFTGRIVTTEAYVDEIQAIGDTHLRLSLIIDNRPVIGWVAPDDPHALPAWQGTFVRLMALYSGRMDPTGTEGTVELWVGRQRDVEVREPIAGSARFNIPVTPIDRVHSTRPGTEVKVRGRLQRRDPGSSLVLRDEGGEIVVQTVQRERVPLGAEIEALGRADVSGGRWVIGSALYRRVPAGPAGPELPAEDTGPLRSVDQIRRLTLEEIARGRPVVLTGLVTWVLPEADFFFLQDVSGGIRVRYSREKTKPPSLQQSLRIEGVTYDAGRSPGIVLATATDLGSMAHPRSRRISLEQALTGREDGQWVMLRGFLRHTESEGDWRWIYVTSPEGEFVGHLQSPEPFVANPGSLIRVQGVCETITDTQGRISGVMLRMPFLHDISIEEDAPADPRGLPLRRVSSLAQLSALQEMARARVTGVVLKHLPGHYVVLDDEGTGLMVLSRTTQPLAPGDRAEAVGILGREGARTILREAEYRRLGAGSVPEPMLVADLDAPSPALDMRLARVRGRLLSVVRGPELTRLTLQSGTTIFDAVLEPAAPVSAPAVGSDLELTGVLKIEFDDARRARGFQLLLRSPADVAVLAPPQLWTVQRALTVAAVLAGCTLLVFVWVAALRHRVRRQTNQIKSQLAQQASLEAELERGQRFRSLGLLAGGIAHDFNNLLTGILGNATLAMLDERAMELVGDCLIDIETSAKRARDLTQHLVTFAKGGDPVRVAVALPELLNGAAGLALSGSKSRADFRYAGDLRPVHADRDQLGRAVQNLVVHAAGSMPAGGIIAIEAANESVGAGDHRALDPGEYVRVTIADRGPGLAPDRLPGFFDPYNATKFGDDRFNLAISYSIVKRHGGHLEVQSQPGLGTTFRLWIPAAAGPVERQPDSAAASTALLPEGLAGKRILLMDDEETIRRLGEKMLQRMNCELRLTTHGEECILAYRTAQEAGTPFDLVILDLTVPGGMGGKEAIVELRKLNPNVRAIVSSGYSTDPVLANFRQYGFRAMVPKPYDVAVLAHAIKDVLELSE